MRRTQLALDRLTRRCPDQHDRTKPRTRGKPLACSSKAFKHYELCALGLAERVDGGIRLSSELLNL
jgi:hypothetical protein